MSRYNGPVIRSFKDKNTATIAAGKSPKGFASGLLNKSCIIIAVLNAAVELNDLRSLAGNHLEKLSGDLKNQYSVRINRQWRFCFDWADTEPGDVEIVDYH
jgi:proteic killer suppression protein